MKKRLLPALLALVMVLSLFPLAAFAAEGDSTGLPTGMTLLEDGKTLQLSSDVTLEGNTLRFYTEIPAKKPNESDIYLAGVETLDLNNHTLSGSKSVIKLHTSNLAITGTGTISNSNAGDSGDGSTIWLMDTGALTIGSGVTVKTGKGGQSYVVSFNNSCKAGAAVTVNGATLEADKASGSQGSGLYVNGLVSDPVKITLNGAKIDVASYGIYQAGTGETTDVTVENSTITAGVTGIEVRAGSLKLVNSTVTGGNGDLKIAANGNGATTENAALAVAQHVTKQNINVTLEGNVTLNGKTALSIANPQANEASNNVKVKISGGMYNGDIAVADTGENPTVAAGTLTITGGTFKSDVTKYVDAANYRVDQSGEGADALYIVKPYIAGKQIRATTLR